MKARTLIATTGLLGVGIAGAALADERCNVRIADWRPRSALVQMAETMGWTVQRIKTDDGCYAIQAVDREGREIRAKVDPASLAVLSTRQMRERHGDGDDDERGERTRGRREHGDRAERGEGGERRGGPAAAAAPEDPNAPPPANGLMKSRPKAQVQ
ncbi:PepSY domain-containing protein [Alsobacter sp. SYSU M60028]|uniref:PepSY domain-containing protein n=1 Tax=Alsobacter ponti TaxID=2962936 RepID=A0ABT1LCY4_9HYPH|nr:PepSY domain-containing protein [Alsobacter ponti]MCP8939294.1 PepSY domain-containing protein [Alsobacter ponti]